jgi:hypothetical protein
MLTSDFIATARRSGLRATEAQITQAVTEVLGTNPVETITDTQLSDLQWALCAIVDAAMDAADRTYFG